MIVNVPMKTQQLVQFIANKGDVTFDFADCSLKPKHAIRYLAYTKMVHSAINYQPELVLEFIKSPALVGKSSLLEDYKNILCMMVHYHMWSIGDGLDQDQIQVLIDNNRTVLEAHLEVIRALPNFLHTLKGTSDPLRGQCLSQGIGVNFARLFEDPAFLTYLLVEPIATETWKESRYFADLFQGPFYGGLYLRDFVERNPDCELIKWATNE